MRDDKRACQTEVKGGRRGEVERGEGGQAWLWGVGGVGVGG